jgi:hypothetical protein
MKRSYIPLVLLMVSCAVQPHSRGVVAMKIDESTAHVCVGKSEVRPGDAVSVYRNVCKSSPKQSTCDKVFIGRGTIRENLNEHYSVATFAAGTHVEEGDMVETGK